MTLDEKRKDQPEIFQECASSKTNSDDMPQGTIFRIELLNVISKILLFIYSRYDKVVEKACVIKQRKVIIL